MKTNHLLFLAAPSGLAFLMAANLVTGAASAKATPSCGCDADDSLLQATLGGKQIASSRLETELRAMPMRQGLPRIGDIPLAEHSEFKEVVEDLRLHGWQIDLPRAMRYAEAEAWTIEIPVSKTQIRPRPSKEEQELLRFDRVYSPNAILISFDPSNDFQKGKPLIAYVGTFEFHQPSSKEVSASISLSASQSNGWTGWNQNIQRFCSTALRCRKREKDGVKARWATFEQRENWRYTNGVVTKKKAKTWFIKCGC